MSSKISHYGTDGFGHQLLGMFSLISACDNNNEFSYIPLEHHGSFEHIDNNTKLKLKQYIDEILILKYGYTIKRNDPSLNLIQVGHAPYHNSFGFQKNNNNSAVYQYDNGWGIRNIGLHIKNTNFQNFIINKFLPDPSFNKSKINIAIHIRGGDGAGRTSGIVSKLYSNQLVQIINKLNNKYDAIFHIFSNDINFEKCIISTLLKEYSNLEYFTYINTCLLSTFSMLVHANILIIGDSSLSISAGYINTHELVLIPDGMSCNNLKICDILDNCFKFNKYLNM